MKPFRSQSTHLLWLFIDSRPFYESIDVSADHITFQINSDLDLDLDFSDNEINDIKPIKSEVFSFDQFRYSSAYFTFYWKKKQISFFLLTLTSAWLKAHRHETTIVQSSTFLLIKFQVIELSFCFFISSCLCFSMWSSSEILHLYSLIKTRE